MCDIPIFDNDQLRSGVFHEITQAVVPKPCVDRYVDSADPDQCKEEHQVVQVIIEHNRHPVSRSNALLDQQVCCLPRLVAQLSSTNFLTPETGEGAPGRKFRILLKETKNCLRVTDKGHRSTTDLEQFPRILCQYLAPMVCHQDALAETHSILVIE